MISKATTKFIKSLQLKKYRKLEGLFVVEGEKSVLEALNSDFKVRQVLGTEKFLRDHGTLLRQVEHTQASDKVLASLGSFVTNNAALAIVEMKENRFKEFPLGYSLALDSINDPGNLGTILRIADWYGIKQVVASHETADFYNPKVIAATKGSFCRVNMYYTSLENFLPTADLPIYGAFMTGENVHDIQFEPSGILLMGNEAKGISRPVEQHVRHKITIPKYGQAESLNVAMATAILCDNIMRKVN